MNKFDLLCSLSSGWRSRPHLQRWLCVVDSWRDRDGTGTSHQDGPGGELKKQQLVNTQPSLNHQPRLQLLT